MGGRYVHRSYVLKRIYFQAWKDNILGGLHLIRMLNFDEITAIGPITVDIAATSACNYQCYFCKAHSYLRSNNISSVFMDGGILDRLVQDLRKLGVKQLLFAGNGEPLLSKELPRVILKQGNHFDINVLTNGSLLNVVSPQLFDNLKHLRISLDSGSGIHHQVIHGYQGKNRFSDIIGQIERLLTYPKARKKIVLYYVITTDNHNEVDQFLDLAKRYGVQHRIRPVSVDFHELEGKALSREAKKENKLYPCYWGFMQPFINSSGDVLLCSEGQKTPLGNIKDESFIAIWQRKENVALRFEAARMHKSKKPLFKGCYDCANAQGQSLAFRRIYSKLWGLRK